MLQLVRIKNGDDAILGRLFLNGAFICWTLENKKKAVPGGVYTVENSKSPKFGRELPLIYNDEVTPMRGVRLHVGNDAVQDSSGCILIGMGHNGFKLVESKVAENMIVPICRNQSEFIISEV